MIISNRLELPWDAGLFTDGGGHVVIFTASEEDPPETATPVTVVRHPDGVELDQALGWLAEEGGIRSVLCEGGPTLHGRLREGGLADELFLTIAPKIAGGEGPRILEGALADVDEVELAWLLESESELFARYRGISSVRTRDRRGGSFQPWTSSPRPRSSPSVERIEAFMDEHVYPVEAEAMQAIDDEVRPGEPYPEILVGIRATAKEQGLWNLFLPDGEHGAGLTNWEYGILCEQMGAARWSRRWPSTARRPTPGTWRSSSSTAPTSRRSACCGRCSTARSAAASR